MRHAAIRKTKSPHLSGVLIHLASGQLVWIRKSKKSVGVLITTQDFMLFERLIPEEEDRVDVKAAIQALQEPGSVPLEKIRAELGL